MMNMELYELLEMEVMNTFHAEGHLFRGSDADLTSLREKGLLKTEVSFFLHFLSS